MAVLISSATGDFTASGTWKLVDATSYLNSETSTIAPSTAYSACRSSAFTPGAITIDAIALKLAVRTGTTGTISVHLELDVGDVDVAGTEATINCSDLPNGASADLNGGWIVFALAAPVLLLAATAYQVAVKTSSASQVGLWRDATATNVSRALRTTTNQAPGAADDLIVAGEHTGAGTGNSFVVTQDQTAATDYGSAPTAANSLITPGLSVCKRGTISWKDTSAANPLLRMSNSVVVYAEGTLNIGTTGTPIPRDSVAVLEFDCAADGDYGLIVRNLSTLNIQGLSRTSGKNIVKCLLNADATTNMALQSNVFDNAAWTKNSSTVSADHTTIGGMVFDKLVEAAASNNHFLQHAVISISVVTGLTYTMSIYASKLAGERDYISMNTQGTAAARTYFNISAGTVGTTGAGHTASIEDIGSGVYRCKITYVASANAQPIVYVNTADNEGSYLGDVTKGVLLSSIQLEQSSAATTYKPTTTVALGGLALSVDTDTGWLSGDQIAVASTTRTAADCETGTLSGNAGASSLAVTNMIVGAAGNAVPPAGSSPLLAYHHGVSPTQAEVILLTRNVKIRSISATLMAYVNIKPTATVDIDWAEFYFLGENATGKRGIEVETTTGAFNMQYSSIHDCEDNGLYLTGAALNNVTYSHNTVWLAASVAGPACQIATATTGTSITIDDNVLIRTLNGNGWTLADVGGTFTNNTVVGAASVGIVLTEANDVGTVSGLVAHSCTGAGVQNGSLARGTITNLTVWRNGVNGLSVTSGGGLLLDGAVVFGNTTNNIFYGTGGPDVTFKNAVVNGDTTFSTGVGLITSGVGGGFIRLIDCDFGTVSGIKTAHTTADINVAASQTGYVIAHDTKLASATEVGTQTALISDAHISLQRLDNTAGNHKTLMRTGTMQTDSTIFNAASPSLRMTPNNASLKLESAPRGKAFLLPVASGATVSVAVYIYKSASGDGAAYNGNQPRLIQRANPAGGVDADVVLATYSAGTGSWNQISGTSTALNDDGSIEIIVDCDGTAGWINVEDLSRDGTVVATMKYWSDGLPDIDPPAAAGSVTPLGSGLHPIEMGIAA